MSKQKIVPNLWFNREAEEAARFYVSVFPNSRAGNIIRAGKAGYEVHGLAEGTVMTMEFELEEQRFVAINGGPIFKFTPALSFLVTYQTEKQVDAAWQRLSEGGKALMELGEYPFSRRYGWTQDRFGLSWQVMLAQEGQAKRGIVPTLLFTREQHGRAEEALRFYVSVFENSRPGSIVRYGPGEEPDKEGTVKHAAFILEGQEFAAMDSALAHEFTFNESVSFMVECETQPEIDFFWDKLTGGGGQESVCGWLKDKFGVSWQVTPTALGQMLRDPDRKKVDRVTDAFLKMKKLDLGELEKAYGRPQMVTHVSQERQR